MYYIQVSASTFNIIQPNVVAMFWVIETWCGHVLGDWNINQPCHQKFNNYSQENKWYPSTCTQNVTTKHILEMKPNLRVMLNPNNEEFETHACTQNIDMGTRVSLNKVIEMSMKCVFEKLHEYVHIG